MGGYQPPYQAQFSMSYTRDSATRRLLVITYHFPPDGAVGGQRWAGLSKYLARLGWEVHVVTASVAGKYPPLPNVHRHARSRRRTLNDFYRARKRQARAPQNSGESLPDSPELEGSLFRPILAMRHVASALVSLPDDARGWIFRAARTARALVRQQDFDVVITSGPPHSAHLVGLLAVIGTGSQRWIDLRDPWAMTYKMHLPTDGLM